MPNTQTDVPSGREPTQRHNLICCKLSVLKLNIENSSRLLHRTKGVINHVENQLMHLHGIGGNRVSRLCDLRPEFNLEGDRRTKKSEGFLRQGMKEQWASTLVVLPTEGQQLLDKIPGFFRRS